MKRNQTNDFDWTTTPCAQAEADAKVKAAEENARQVQEENMEKSDEAGRRAEDRAAARKRDLAAAADVFEARRATLAQVRMGSSSRPRTHTHTHTPTTHFFSQNPAFHLSI